MRKRVRKKLRLHEFREDGFEVSFEIPDTTAWNDEFFAFIEEAIEGNHLLFGGSPNGGFVTVSGRRGSATEDHREVVKNWLERRSKIRNVRIGQLRDAWHGWKESDWA